MVLTVTVKKESTAQIIPTTSPYCTFKMYFWIRNSNRKSSLTFYATIRNETFNRTQNKRNFKGGCAILCDEKDNICALLRSKDEKVLWLYGFWVLSCGNIFSISISMSLNNFHVFNVFEFRPTRATDCWPKYSRSDKSNAKIQSFSLSFLVRSCTMIIAIHTQYRYSYSYGF